MTQSESSIYFQFPESLWSEESLVKHYFIQTNIFGILFYKYIGYIWQVCVQCLLFIYLKKGFSAEFQLFWFPHPTLHTLASPSIWGCKSANNTYSSLTHTHLVTGQTARQFHEIFPIQYCLVLNTCVILSWYHTVSVSVASWFSFNPSGWTYSVHNTAYDASSRNYTLLFCTDNLCLK